MTDRERLLKSRLPERDIDLDGVGTIRVRGLSRAEVLACHGKERDELEPLLLATAMVEPALTEDDIVTWRQAATTNEIKAVLDVVWDLSGLGEGAAKATYKSLPEEPTP